MARWNAGIVIIVTGFRQGPAARREDGDDCDQCCGPTQASAHRALRPRGGWNEPTPARPGTPGAASRESEKREGMHGGNGGWFSLVDAWSPVPIEIAVRSFHPTANI